MIKTAKEGWTHLYKLQWVNEAKNNVAIGING